MDHFKVGRYVDNGRDLRVKEINDTHAEAVAEGVPTAAERRTTPTSRSRAPRTFARRRSHRPDGWRSARPIATSARSCCESTTARRASCSLGRRERGGGHPRESTIEALTAELSGAGSGRAGWTCPRAAASHGSPTHQRRFGRRRRPREVGCEALLGRLSNVDGCRALSPRPGRVSTGRAARERWACECERPSDRCDRPQPSGRDRRSGSRVGRGGGGGGGTKCGVSSRLT